MKAQMLERDLIVPETGGDPGAGLIVSKFFCPVLGNPVFPLLKFGNFRISRRCYIATARIRDSETVNGSQSTAIDSAALGPSYDRGEKDSAIFCEEAAKAQGNPT